MRLREALSTARARLAACPELAAGAVRDAEILLLHTLQISRPTLLAYPERELTVHEQTQYDTTIVRRLAFAPIQYILGAQEFYGLTLQVTPAVLIPRPETEHLVEAVLERLPVDTRARILDVGTGSGAIAITLAVHRPKANLTAVDISPEALTVARANAQVHNLQERIRFFESDLLEALRSQTFDIIVSNPPYVPLLDSPYLHAQVREHEPHLALFAGDTGLDLYIRLIPQAFRAIAPGGLLALEIGWGQKDALADLLSSWTDVSFIEDLQGIPRVALAIRPA
jgi:release factor glutamine methyltransferase